MMTSNRAARVRVLALAFVVFASAGSFLIFAPSAKAAATAFQVDVGKYTGGYLFVPGETITFTLTVDNAAGQQFDVVLVDTTTNTILQQYNNTAVPASSTASLSFAVTSTMKDGGGYLIQLGNANYIETGRAGGNQIRLAFAGPCTYSGLGGQPVQCAFSVQEYALRVETNRAAYVPGDSVTITWSANRLKDGSLATFTPPGSGQLQVVDANGTWLLTSPNPYPFSNATASFTFQLPITANPSFDAFVTAYYNDSASNPLRIQSAFASFHINRLSSIVEVPLDTYQPGAIVTVDVWTVAWDNQAVPQKTYPEPGITVNIIVSMLVGGVQAGYGATGLVTDAHGRLTHSFKLDPATADGSQFTVQANVTHPSAPWSWTAQDTFRVSAVTGITLELAFNAQAQYQAGDTAVVTSVVTGAAAGATLTYRYEVRDTSNTGCPTGATGTLLATTAKTSTSPEDTFSYQTPAVFSGQVCFTVWVVDDASNSAGPTSREFDVVFGWLLVNANPQQYSPGDTITVSWELRSLQIQSPTYFYNVWDAGSRLVTSGQASGTQFQFTVPAQASRSYLFTVSAAQNGRTVSGSALVNKVGGFLLTVTFDRASYAYAPGETIKVHYVITATGTNPLPSTFSLMYGLAGVPSITTATTSSQGDLEYRVPGSVNQGNVPFGVTETNTGSSAANVLTIRSTNPLQFATVGDIPVITVIILVWLILVTLMMWRRGMMGGMGAKAPPAPPAGPAKQEPVHAPPTSPMTVTCRSCSSPIEITTSKRPIEVMCPKCGNTEVVS